MNTKSIIDIESSLEKMANEMYELAVNTRDMKSHALCISIENELISLSNRYSGLGKEALYFKEPA